MKHPPPLAGEPALHGSALAACKAWLAATLPVPDRVLVEQLRLVHANAARSFGATLAAAALTVGLLHSTGQGVSLGAWLAAIAVWCLATMWLARWVLSSHRAQANPARSYLLTLALYALYGALWSLLPWLTLDHITPANTIWVVCVLAGVLAGGMTFMAPLRQVYAAFATLLALPVALHFLLRGEPAYWLLGGGALLMLATVIGQAATVSRSLRSMIELRFSNEAVLAEMHAETERARRALASAEAARQEAEAAHREARAAHQEATAARHAAEAADLAKSKFLAAASHDLRQPVHAQGLFLEVLAGTALTAHQAELLASARIASRASQEMLNTLLDFSRIEAGVVQPHRQAFTIQSLLHNIENDLAPLADAKALTYRSPETAAVVDADAALVEMILRNLISNAIRYTERGGVLIACRRRSGSLVVEVRDTGIGIAPEHQAEVFREFHQLGNPERDRRKGLGLGLAIAKGLADTCGHALTLTSRPGRGSIFRLTLPLIPVADVPGVPGAPAMTPVTGSTAQLYGTHVLVLDDDETVLAGMAQLLHSWGCTCATADTISAALFAAHQLPPALFITDFRLREQDSGTTAAATLRWLLGADLPVLMITGDTAPVRLREAAASGVPLLHKPVRPDQLHEALIQLMPMVRARETREAYRT